MSNIINLDEFRAPKLSEEQLDQALLKVIAHNTLTIQTAADVNMLAANALEAGTFEAKAEAMAAWKQKMEYLHTITRT